ncbi:unnamed protein product [Cuscuta epithymum]|uniref:Secreted protein n=1 Tax=Cuscuta epithymum TaxID=186058 RepID=A0AAV0FUG7_9ASTE|nr:unnamed protein product [Cuscuta epithymum]
MSRVWVFLIGVIGLVNFRCSWLIKLFQPCCSDDSNTRPPSEPPPRSGKKKMLNWISFSVASQTDASENFCSIDFPLLVAGQTYSLFPMAGEDGSVSCNFLFSL